MFAKGATVPSSLTFFLKKVKIGGGFPSASQTSVTLSPSFTRAEGGTTCSFRVSTGSGGRDGQSQCPAPLQGSSVAPPAPDSQKMLTLTRCDSRARLWP